MDVSEENEMNELLKEALDALTMARDYVCVEGTYREAAQVSDAIAKLTAALSSVEAKPEPKQAGPFFVGNWYLTQGGDPVRIVGVANEGKDCETVFDQHGCHRYTQADYLAGRITGSAHDFSHPGNIAAPLASVEAQSRLSEAAIPLEPTVEWFKKVVQLAGVWPGDDAPDVLWQAAQKYHRAMIAAAQAEGSASHG